MELEIYSEDLLHLAQSGWIGLKDDLLAVAVDNKLRGLGLCLADVEVNSILAIPQAEVILVIYTPKKQ